VDHSPKALQLLGKDFVLGAFGSHDGEPDFIAAGSRFRGLRARREARLGGRRYRAPSPASKRDTLRSAFWLRILARQASAARCVFGCRSARSEASTLRRPSHGHHQS
jgi:hypothetical protein